MSKVIFNKSKIEWFRINANELIRDFKYLGVECFAIDEYKYINHENTKTNEITNVNLNEIYLGVSLYEVCIYNICNDLLIFKDELQIDLHRQVILKWFYTAKTIIDDFTNIFSRNQFSLVIAINGHNLLDACLLAFAKKYKLPFLCIENTSNKNKLVWDDVTGRVITYNLAKTYFHKFKNEVNEKHSRIYASNFKASVFKNKKQEHLSNHTSKIPFSVPYILFLGQVYTDAAQLFAIEEDDFKNPVEIIRSTIEICSSLKIPLVIKLHPKEIFGKSPVVEKFYDMPTYKRIRDYQSTEVHIDYLNNYNTFTLIENSLAVVTGNSQAGLEACLYNKPVITYINSFFSGLGFTYDYHDKHTIKKNITYIVENNIKINKDLSLSQKFFYIFFEKYCIENSISNLIHRILKSGIFNTRIWFKLFTFKAKAYFIRIIKTIKEKFIFFWV